MARQSWPLTSRLRQVSGPRIAQSWRSRCVRPVRPRQPYSLPGWTGVARNVAFIANLMDADIQFLACDQPFASRLTLHILAAVAEDEARRISEWTKAALQAAKVRGRKLGSPIAGKTVAKARAARSVYAAKANATTLAVIREIQNSGVTTLAAIARALMARGVKTPGGRSQWQPVQVSRLLAAGAAVGRGCKGVLRLRPLSCQDRQESEGSA